MNPIYIIRSVLFVFCFFFNSCKKDTPANCPDPKYYSFTASDLSKIPYTGKETLKFLFKDSVKTDTFIFKPISVISDTSHISEILVSEYCDQEEYGHRKKLVYQNTKLTGVKYYLTINYTANGGSANFSATYDSIIVNDFLIIVNNPGWGHYHSSLTFEGNTFYAVSDYESGSLTRFYKLYYTSHDGIVRMEYKNGTSLTLLP